MDSFNGNYELFVIILKMKNICIIPARGGSKRIPRKNIKEFLGKPIIAYSIEAALKSGLFDEVMVSTDDEEIAAIAKQYGAKVPFLRSAETANDFAGTEDVIAEVLNRYAELGKQFDNLCCIYATAPFVTVENLQRGFSSMNKGNYDSVFTVVNYSYPIQRALHVVDGKICLLSPQYKDSRSQDLEKTYHDAGQFYIERVSVFQTKRELWTDNTFGLELPEMMVQDLDTQTDWELAEVKFKVINGIE